MGKLKPCPFCGGEAHIQTFHFRYRVGCGTSGCIAGRLNRAYGTPEEAAAAWNRRAGRTCRNKADAPQSFLCGKCGWFDTDVDGLTLEYSYCPHCGARVMGE